MNAKVNATEQAQEFTFDEIDLILKTTDLKEKQNLIIENILNDVPHINPFLYATDSYKVSHKRFETSGVKEIYSNFTPRFSKYLQDLLGDAYDGKYVVFGIQWLLLRLHVMSKTGFFDQPKEKVIAKMKKVHSKYIGNEDFKHFESLHDLGYLPIVVKTLDEGTTAPVGVPFLTIRNTLPEFEWLPNFLETVISTDLWKELTVATIARAFRQISNEYALETMGTLEGTEWQNHDFSCRGQSGLESSAINGVGFLLSSCGTDNIMSLWASEKFYFSTNEEGMLAGSVSAGEHSVTTSGILTEQERAQVVIRAEEKDITEVEAEREIIIEKVEAQGITLLAAERRYAYSVLTEKFPNGIVAYVADSFDFWSFVSIILPSLKNEVLARDGKFVVRGDSGNPVDVICGIENADVKDLIARNFVDEAQVGKVFTVNDVDYKVNSVPQLHTDNYLPFFLLEDRGYISKWSPELEKAEIEKQVKNLEAQIFALVDLRNDNLSNETFVETANEKIAELENEILNLKYVEPERYVVQAEAKGTIEVLWEIFGGDLTATGYKILDSHIGMIYGDGITVQRSQQIHKRLKDKGFASLNIVFGVGSYSLNMISRDHLGMAIKATNTIVDINGVDVDKPIYKDPKTDTTKKSARGLIRVFENEDGQITFDDKQSREGEDSGLLTVVYKDGQFEKLTTVFEIRDRIWS